MNTGAAAAADPVGSETQREIELFLFEEARLLDERRFDAWVDLFTEDGFYWVPSEPGQTSPDHALSIFSEGKDLLRLRAQRFGHPQMHVQNPQTRTHHHVGGVTARGASDGEYDVRSLVLVAEWRGAEQRFYSGSCRHVLRRSPAGLRIAFKRVDLLNCDAPHRAIAVPF